MSFGAAWLMPSSQVWLEGAARGGAVSMSEFSRLSADWDLSRRALNTGEEMKSEMQQTRSHDYRM